MKIQILDNESLIDEADFENCKVWILNRTNENKLDERLINISEITESLQSNVVKFPLLMTEIYKKYCPYGIQEDFSYEILTKNKKSFFVTYCICNEQNIRNIEK